MINKQHECVRFIQNEKQTPENWELLRTLLKELSSDEMYSIFKYEQFKDMVNFAGVAVLMKKLKFLDVVLEVEPKLLCQTSSTIHYKGTSDDAGANEVVSTEGKEIILMPALMIAIGSRSTEAVEAILGNAVFSEAKKQDLPGLAHHINCCLLKAITLYDNTSTEELAILATLTKESEALAKKIDRQKTEIQEPNCTINELERLILERLPELANPALARASGVGVDNESPIIQEFDGIINSIYSGSTILPRNQGPRSI